MRVRGVDARRLSSRSRRERDEGRLLARHAGWAGEYEPPTATARIRHVPDRRPGSHPKSSLVKIPREISWRDAGREAHEGKVASRSPAGAKPLALGTRVNLSSIERRLRDHARQHSIVPAPGAPGDERVPPGPRLGPRLVLPLSPSSVRERTARSGSGLDPAASGVAGDPGASRAGYRPHPRHGTLVRLADPPTRVPTSQHLSSAGKEQRRRV